MSLSLPAAPDTEPARVFPSSPAAVAPVLARLRAETRAEHDAIEAALPLMGPGLTREGYRRLLARFLGVYRPLEAVLAGLGDWTAQGIDLQARRKAPWLVADLRALGEPDPAALPDCPGLPPLPGVAAGFGCLYVMEGATLGGQLIARHLRESLGLHDGNGARFHHGYGARNGAMWQSFRTALAAHATAPAVQDEVVAAAIATFRALRSWCREAPGA